MMFPYTYFKVFLKNEFEFLKIHNYTMFIIVLYEKIYQHEIFVYSIPYFHNFNIFITLTYLLILYKLLIYRINDLNFKFLINKIL